MSCSTDHLLITDPVLTLTSMYRCSEPTPRRAMQISPIAETENSDALLKISVPWRIASVGYSLT